MDSSASSRWKAGMLRDLFAELADFVLHLAALLVLVVELAGEVAGARGIVGEEQLDYA